MYSPGRPLNLARLGPVVNVMVQVSGSMEQNGAVTVPQPSLSNMSFGPSSVLADDDDDASFIVVERMTREDGDKIESELAASVRGLRVDGEGSLHNSVAFHLDRSAPAPGPSGTQLNGEVSFAVMFPFLNISWSSLHCTVTVTVKCLAVSAVVQY